MKLLYSILCFLILFLESSYAHKGLKSSICEPDLFLDEEIVGDIMPLAEFVQLMHSLKVYSTVDFVNLKRDGDLPLGVPDRLGEVVKAHRELQVHSKLRDNLEILWGMVREMRDTQGQTDATERRQMTEAEFQNFMAGFKKSLENEGDTLEEGRSKRIGNDGDKGSQNNIEHQNSKGQTTTENGSKKGSGWIWNNKAVKKKKSSRDTDFKEKRKIRILLIFLEDERMTLFKLANRLNISKRLLDQLVAELKSEKRVRREGNSSHGRWVIPEKEKLKLISQKEDIGEKSVSDDPEP